MTLTGEGRSPVSRPVSVIDAARFGGHHRAERLAGEVTEAHGFRRAENIKRSLDGELYFYSKVFGFDADVEIDRDFIERLHNFPPGQ